MTQLADFVHESLAGMFEAVRVPAVWTVAHRGYSGNRRLDVWIYCDENTALRAAAELAMSCGVDEEPVAVGHFRQRHCPAVISRYLQTSPDWHVLAVQEAPLMLGPDTFSPLSWRRADASRANLLSLVSRSFVGCGQRSLRAAWR